MISFLKYSKFKFGDQHVSQFILFEHKFWFSIIFFYFHKSEVSQDRFHTHAFNGWSFKLFGQYTEYVLLSKLLSKVKKERRTSFYKFFPKNCYHKIGDSNGCLTVLFTGAWDETWEEFKDGNTTIYNHNRKTNKIISYEYK